MVNSEDQINVLINYKSNFAGALKDAEDRVNSLTASVINSQNRFKEIAKSRTQSANIERKLIKENIITLQKELVVSTKIAKSKQEANSYVSKGVLTQRNALDTMLKDNESYNKRASDIIKNRLIKDSAQEDQKLNNMLKAQEAINSSIITDNTKRFNAETTGNKQVVTDILANNKNIETSNTTKLNNMLKAQEAINSSIITGNTKRFNAETTGNKQVVTDILANRKQANATYEADTAKLRAFGLQSNKQANTESLNLHKKNIADKLRVSKEATRQKAQTWEGALPGSGVGTTFGHKFLTTAQYAAAGVGIGLVAGAVVNLGVAALESELNMRTMAAVLDLNIPKAMELDASVRKLGETYGGVATDIEQVALALGRAGVKTKDIVAATEVTLAMARLTGDTFEQSTSAIISYQQVFGNTTSIETLGDKLAYVANVSRLSTQDIGTFSNYALAAAKDVGLTEDAVGGLAAAFSNAGVNASTIGTQIRRFTTLLTDDSEAVAGFFRNIGVNQANLLADLQKGGKASNEALLGFVKMLHTVDKAKFTNLTGQMDILAANSLQLMRNNSSNIDKFVKDLQTGMEGQLDSTSKILDSYLVTFQSMWNSLANISAKGLQGFTDDLTQVSRLFDIMSGDRERAALKGLKLDQDKDDANILRYRKMREIGEKDNKGRIVDATVLAEYEDYFAKKRVDRDAKVKQLLGKPIKVDTTETIKAYDAVLDVQQKVIDNFGKDPSIDDKALESALSIQKEYLALKKELVITTQSEVTKQGNLSNIQRSSLNEQISLIRALKDSGADVSEQEKQMYSNISANKTKNEGLINNQITALHQYSEEAERVKAVVSSVINEPLKLEAAINRRLDELKSLDSKYITDSLVREANTLNEIKKINKESLSDVQGILSYKNQIVKSQDTEISKAERIRQLSSGVTEAKQKQLDLEGLISDEGYTQIALAERKLIKAKESEASALKLFNSFKGTDEETKLKLLKAYEEKKLSTAEKQFDYSKKSNDIAKAIAKAQEAAQNKAERVAKAQEAAQNKAERAAEKLVNLENEITAARTSSAEIFAQINNHEEESLAKAESKLRVDANLLALAYEQYTVAVGTTAEKEKLKDYEVAIDTYAKSSLKYITKAKEEEIARVNLMAQYKDNLDSSLASQEYRLGLVKEERLNDVEKLRMQAQQDFNAKKIGTTELASINAQIDRLEVLSNKKKDIHSFAIEYQRQLDDQETVGYNAMKAGITSLESGMMNFFDITSEGWLDWHSLASDVLSSIYKQLLEQLVIKQLVSGITGGISYGMSNISTASTYGTNIGSQQTSMLQAQDAGLGYALGGTVPSKGYATGGMLSGGTGIRDDIYLGNVGGTQMFAMGGEFITRKSSVNEDTKGTLDYINKTGSAPSQGSQVNVPVKINIENQTGSSISADMIQSMTQTNDKGEYEKVVNIVLKASMVDPRMRNLLKGR